MFVFNLFTFNLFAFDIFPFNLFPFNIFLFNIFAFDIFTFDIFTFDISAFDIFTPQIHFYIIPKNPQMCPAHRDLPTPSHPHSRLNLPHPIPSHTYNGLKTFSLSTTLQAVFLHRLNLSFPAPSHTDTSQQNSRPPQPSTPKKSPRGVQRGRGFAAPLRFSFFLKKILCAIRQKSKRHTVFKKKYF